MDLLRLSNKVRFRREADHILMCDLRTLRDYAIPLHFWPVLERLSVGCDLAGLGSEALDLVHDLKALDLLSEGDASPRIWETLEFE